VNKVLHRVLLSVAYLAPTFGVSAASEGVLTITKHLLSQRLMLEAATTALDFCTAANVRAHVVIVDATGLTHLIIVSDGGNAQTIDGARRKAYTAAMTGRATQVIAEQLAANPKMLVPPDPVMLFLAGGLPIRVGNEVIGAIAVGGGLPEQDAKCAQAGLDKIQPELH
jgi:uncharacterized protein GlcG (DUF336 family)